MRNLCDLLVIRQQCSLTCMTVCGRICGSKACELCSPLAACLLVRSLARCSVALCKGHLNKCACQRAAHGRGVFLDGHASAQLVCHAVAFTGQPVSPLGGPLLMNSMAIWHMHPARCFTTQGIFQLRRELFLLLEENDWACTYMVPCSCG